MVDVSKIELNLTHFYTNPNFILALWKDLTELNQKQLRVLKIVLFGEVMWENIYLYLTEWEDIRKYDVIKRCTYTSSYT